MDTASPPPLYVPSGTSRRRITRKGEALRISSRLQLLAAAAWLIGASAVGAQTTTGESASLVVFPKVVVDADWETTIQLSNNANRPARAVCYYVNGALTFPDLPPGPANPPLWTQVDFRLTLERQQPTHWVVSRGRALDDADNLCATPFAACDGTGRDPGIIPPVVAGFTGELLCYEVDASGAPWSGNALSGHATLTQLSSGAVAKYPAVGSAGLPANDSDGTLCLGGEPDGNCPRGAEYRGCPQLWTISHPSDVDDRQTDGAARFTRLTFAPCGQDFRTQQPQRLTLQFEVVNELEQRFSTSASVDCWAELALGDVNPIFTREVLGADSVQTRVRSSAASASGFVVVQQTDFTPAGSESEWLVATVPPQVGDETRADLIRVPEEGGQ